jgi:phage terminase small subunit
MVDHRSAEVRNINEKANGIVIDAVAPPPEFRTAYDQLKPTERTFVDAYVATADPVQATEAAFPMLAGGSRGLSAAQVRTMDFVKRPLIQAAIAERMAAKMSQWDLTADRVLAELAKIAYSNIDDFIDRSTGEPLFNFTPDKVTRDQMAAVGELTVEVYNEGRGENAREVKRFKFKLHDKLSALDKAMKRLGLFEPTKVDLTSNGQTINGTSRNVPVVASTMTAAEAAELYGEALREDSE